MTTMIEHQQHPTTTSCSSRIRTVSVENIPKEELEASSAMNMASKSSKVNVKNAANKVKRAAAAAAASDLKKKNNNKTSTTNIINMKGKSLSFIHKPHPESKVGIDLIEKSYPKNSVYIRSICPGCLAAKQTPNLISGLRIYQVNGMNVESAEEADLVIRTCDNEVSILTQSYMEVEASKKKRGFRLGGSSSGVGLTLASAGAGGSGGIVISKVNPKGLFPTLQPGQHILSINGRSMRNVDLATKMLKNFANLKLVVVEPDDVEETTTASATATSSNKNNYMDKFADDFVEGDDYENFVLQSFDSSASSSGIQGEGFEKSSTVSTALMSSTVRSYSVSCEYDLMDKISIQMKDFDDEVMKSEETDDDVSSVISEMTAEEDNHDGCDHDNDDVHHNSSSTTSSSSSSRRRVVISVNKSSPEDVCGIKAMIKKKNDDVDDDEGKIYITEVSNEGLFGQHSKTLVGASIEYINGIPCPSTTSEFVEELRQAYPRLVLECTFPPSNNSKDNNVNNGKEDEVITHDHQGQQRRLSSSTRNRRDMLLKEPSNFSCLDQHLEEILPENFSSSKIQYVEGSKVIAVATKGDDPEQKAGLRLRQSNPTDSIFISCIASDSMFLDSSLQVGMKILTINGKPCPSTTTDTVQAIKDITGQLKIEAVMIDWDATLSDAWTAAAASQQDTKTKR